MQGASWVKLALAIWAGAKPSIFYVTEHLFTYSAEYAVLFILFYWQKTMVFKLVMALIAGVKFTALTTPVCDYVEF